ncbi:MAG: dCTP deaminase [Chloroflexota bacterium]|nr:dCTP deaminase [Chloroflexota bacterium]
MLLSDKRIMEEFESGNIVIDPFNPQQLGTNSYDCRLGEWYFQGDANVEVIHIDNRAEIRGYWGEPRQARERQIAIRPGTTILAHTQEVIGGHNGYLAKMYARSTVARSGLSVCRCAGVGDVGYISRWTMEISNHTQTTIWIPVGFRICQLTFEFVGPTLKEYRGKYGRAIQQWTPEDMLPKPYLDWDYEMYSTNGNGKQAMSVGERITSESSGT